MIHIIRYISVNSSKIYESREGVVCENVVNLIILCFIFIFLFPVVYCARFLTIHAEGILTLVLTRAHFDDGVVGVV